MDVKKAYLLAVLALLFGVACKNQRTASDKDTYASTFQELREFIEKPDSLLTQEQKTKKEELFKIVLEKITVKNNQFYNSAKIKDFTDKGLSKYYYDILEKSLMETNQWVKDEKISNLDSVFQSSKDILFKME
ncbi:MULTISPECIES: hypothetical protein [unclassified Proteiniphilum]|jgi:hypothetical protein|uniref:hypothetical protein n=1 Tax=unclassified Proteiniphilum TaxID=2622718 RepID=UPI00257EFE9A|nr:MULTISPECIES: hypothetical protein [unclassified Proteiniphilum]